MQKQTHAHAYLHECKLTTASKLYTAVCAGVNLYCCGANVYHTSQKHSITITRSSPPLSLSLKTILYGTFRDFIFRIKKSFGEVLGTNYFFPDLKEYR